MFTALANVLLPPASLAWIAYGCLMADGRWRRTGIAALGLLLLFAMPITPSLLLAALDPPASPEETLDPARAPEAIVILSGDAIRLPDASDLDPGPLTLDRMRAGAALHRRTGLPILVSGGVILGHQMPLATMMARSLEQDFRVEVRWREAQSSDTWQNASFSAAILRQAGISRIFLVTHGWHMRRALVAFRRYGLEATPAPVRADLQPNFYLADFIPNASAWGASYFALHEWLGLAYYNLRP